jgi:hypothetical protein
MLKKHVVLFTIFFFFISFNLNSQSRKEIRQQKALLKKQKKIEKFKDTTWLTIKDSIGYFTDDKRSYRETSSMESSSEKARNFINKDMNNFTERASFKNDQESKIGTYILEEKIVQAVLFKSDFKKLIIEIIATCNSGLNSKSTLVLEKKEIDEIRKVNTIDSFITGRFKTPFLAEKKMLNTIEGLCF